MHSTTTYESSNVASLSIATLDPSKEPPRGRTLHGVVSLLWPYSSSTRSAAFLLVEPDFRLRRKKGQVRVQLAGAAARAVAESRIGIGDLVELWLDGASWTGDGSHVNTPGRSVDGDLLFRREIVLNAHRDGVPFASLNVDASASPPASLPPSSPLGAATLPSPQPQTPHPQTHHTVAQPSRGESFDTPFRLSFGYQSALKDAFTDDWEIEERPGKRLRVSGAWQYVRRSESPPDEPNAVETASLGAQQLAIGLDGSMDVGNTTGLVIPETARTVEASAVTPTKAVFIDVPTIVGAGGNQTLPADRPSASELPRLRTSLPSEDAFAVPMSVLPQTPSQPRLAPVQSAVLPLVSPMAPWAPPVDARRPILGGDVENVESRGPYPVGTSLSRPSSATASLQDDAKATKAVSEDNVARLEQSRINEETYPRPNQDERFDEQVLFRPSLTAVSPPIRQLSPAVPSLPHHTGEAHRRKSLTIIDLSDDEEESPVSSPLRKDNVLDHQFIGKVTDITSRDGVAPNSSSSRNIDVEDSVGSVDARSRSAQDADIIEDKPSSYSAPQGVEKQAVTPGIVLRETDRAYDRSSQQSLGGNPHETAFQPAPFTVQVIDSEDVVEAPHRLDQQQPTPEASQERASGVLQSRLLGHRVDQILDGRLPPTPESSLIPAEMIEATGASAPEMVAPPKNVQTTLRPDNLRTLAVQPSTEVEEEQQESSEQTVTRHKRICEVPSVLSPWFTSGRKSAQRDSPVRLRVSVRTREESLTPTASVRSTPNIGFDFTADATAGGSRGLHKPQLSVVSNRPLADALAPTSKSEMMEGIRTKHSYYTPLSNLEQYLNPPSQSSMLVVDIMAVVTSLTSPPERAKTGPKDFFTILHITDKSSGSDKTQVQIFRPFKSSLPLAHVGDVILLRTFLIKSRLRKCYLLSGEGSGWHVWRFSQLRHADRTGETPVRAPAKADGSEELREECRGPPVEVGIEERENAFSLRKWWVSRQHGRTEQSRAIDLESSPQGEETNGAGAMSEALPTTGVLAGPRAMMSVSP